MLRSVCLFFLIRSATLLHAQMYSGGDTLYGNEWIRFDQTYFRFDVAADGIYRIEASALAGAGIPYSSISGASWRIYRNGRQIPIFTSTSSNFGSADFLEFYGEKNRCEPDSFLFDHPEAEMLNPQYSLFNDTAAYYLTWENDGTPLRMTAMDNNLAGAPPPEPWCWFRLEKIFQETRFKRRRSSDITMSWFDGEGFAQAPLASSPVAFNPVKLNVAGPPAKAALRYGCDLGGHEQLIKIRKSSLDTLFFTDVFQGFRIVQHKFNIPLSWLGTQTRISLESVNLIDKHALAFVSLTYPRLTDAGNESSFACALDPSPEPRFLKISHFKATGQEAPLLFDLDGGYRIQTAFQQDTVRVVLPAASGGHQLLLVDPASAVQRVTNLRLVSFRDFSAASAQFILITHPRFFYDPATGANPVQEYADYRESSAGGGYSTVVVNLADLYEQFAYGVHSHPLAIRNFAHWVKKHWPDPRFLFLVGKGLHYDLVRTPANAQAYADSLFFVPVFGNPGTDQLFVSGNEGAKPVIPVGRLPVTRASEIRDYLDKVRAYDMQFQAPQTSERVWMKKILHLSGGIGIETATIRDALLQMEQIARQSRTGSEVRTFYKTSSAPVETSTFESIRKEVNEGTALITLLGHSAPQTVDFDIGNPEDYQNAGKYPVMLTMGCFSGLCATPAKGLGEKFVLAKNKGAIAFFASANYGLLESLRVYGKTFYSTTGGTGYGKTLGEQMSETAGVLAGTGDDAMASLLHQMILQGDPALRLYAAPGPDWLVDPASVSVTPNPVSIDQGGYQLHLDLLNLGENTGGDLAVRVRRQGPDGTLQLLKIDTVEAPAYRSMLDWSFPMPGREAAGFNRLLVDVDPFQQRTELPAPGAESNNELRDAVGQPGIEVYFFAGDLQTVYPPAYGIVGDAAIVLRASTFDIPAENRRYLFEIDSTPFFNSPLRQAGQVIQPGGLVQWSPPAPLPAHHVYYWRVAHDSLGNGQVVWRNSSFLFEPGSQPGWNQSHPFQFTDNSFTDMMLDSVSRGWEFATNAAFGAVSVDWLATGRFPGFQNSYFEGFTGYGGFISKQVRRGVVVALLDPLTGHFQLNPQGSPTNPNPLGPVYFHHFDTNDSLKRVALMDFLQTGIPGGWYALLLALKNPAQDSLGFAPEKWAADSVSYGANLFQLLEQRGAREVRRLETTGSVPYGFVFRQNDPAFPAADTLLTDPSEAVELRRNFQASWASGQMESVPIGPAKSWGRVLWQHEQTDAPGELLELEVLGHASNNVDTLLLRLDAATDTADLAGISAGDFPYLKLRLTAQDSVKRTLPDIRRLQVLYQPLPEGAIQTQPAFVFHADTLLQGDRLRLSAVFQNIGQTAFDSLRLRYRLENRGQTVQSVLTRRRGLPAGDTLQLPFQAETLQLEGPGRLTVEVNPQEDQPEQFSFNNVLILPFEVVPDKGNPLLDVTFDGFHIMPGDLVSARPWIVATLQDQNPFQLLTDTATFSMELLFPDYHSEIISWNDPRVNFIPATGNKGNKARLEFRPEFQLDGTYRLQINGRDASGNISGPDYRISFEVVTKSAISNLLNYPNPFSTSTCFYYTLTGSEPPARFTLQIMTVAGRVVREVTENEFGPLFVGTHQSRFCWDGTDQFGDALANGVYLYRVIARKPDGSRFDLLPDDRTDGFFSHGIGKMVLAR